MYSELIYQIALTQVPNIGTVHAKTLIEHFGHASTIFKTKKSLLAKINGIGTIRAEHIHQFQHFELAEKELKFIEQYKIKPLFITEEHYPKRLLNCYDSPIILYYRGEANLNSQKIISIVGTRNNTDYGRIITEKIIKELANEKILIVSGLAHGVDTLAHKASLKNCLPTIGVLAHGLDILYPAANTKLAKQMISEGGGILTEFMSGTKPDKHHFPTRNRLVAGMADATIVVETDIKGGSMITAELANNYNRDVFAFPGKTTDAKSKGCNHLIRNNKAALITSAQDLLELMGWLPQPHKKQKIQKELFIELSTNEQTIVDILNQYEQLPIDDIYLKSQLSASAVSAALLSLELRSVVLSFPGKIYKIG